MTTKPVAVSSPQDVTAEFDKSVTANGLTLRYDEFGTGDRVLVLLPPSAMPRRLDHPLARQLAARGHRASTSSAPKPTECTRAMSAIPPRSWARG